MGCGGGAHLPGTTITLFPQSLSTCAHTLEGPHTSQAHTQVCTHTNPHRCTRERVRTAPHVKNSTLMHSHAPAHIQARSPHVRRPAQVRIHTQLHTHTNTRVLANSRDLAQGEASTQKTPKPKQRYTHPQIPSHHHTHTLASRGVLWGAARCRSPEHTAGMRPRAHLRPHSGPHTHSGFSGCCRCPVSSKWGQRGWSEVVVCREAEGRLSHTEQSSSLKAYVLRVFLSLALICLAESGWLHAATGKEDKWLNLKANSLWVQRKDTPVPTWPPHHRVPSSIDWVLQEPAWKAPFSPGKWPSGQIPQTPPRCLERA